MDSILNPEEKTNVDPKTINMSSSELTPDEIQHLKRDFKSCPTSKNRPELGTDIQDFERQLGLWEFSHGESKKKFFCA